MIRLDNERTREIPLPGLKRPLLPGVNILTGADEQAFLALKGDPKQYVLYLDGLLGAPGGLQEKSEEDTAVDLEVQLEKSPAAIREMDLRAALTVVHRLGRAGKKDLLLKVYGETDKSQIKSAILKFAAPEIRSLYAEALKS